MKINKVAHSIDWLFALGGGALLAGMINLNSQLAKYTTPIHASWIAHGLGSVAALLLVFLYSILSISKSRSANPPPGNHPKPLQKPIWAYFGGVPGAFTVILAAIAVNSRLALSGAVALMLVGQVIFGMISDRFGLFGVPRKKIRVTDLFVVFFILSGSWILIFFGR